MKLEVIIRGDTVIIRAFRGDALIRKIWAVGQRVVYVTDDENYGLLKSGQGGLSPVGVPKEDVFVYKPSIKIPDIEWEKLEPWNGQVA